MIKISAVEYLNTLPFVHGIKNSGYMKNYQLELDIPSVCSEKMIAQKADIGLVPVITLEKIKNYKIITDYCIGAERSVGSVLLLSDVPIKNIKSIYLDYHSRTTNSLVQLLFHKHLGINVLYKSGTLGFESKIQGEIAGVVIGDRALKMSNKFKYTYDLASLWNHYTGLPFVFACWVAIENISQQVLDDFCNAIDWGIKHKHDVIKNVKSSIDLKDYFENCISYNFDQNKKHGMKLFLEDVKSINTTILAAK